jgi:hypothetical protein
VIRYEERVELGLCGVEDGKADRASGVKTNGQITTVTIDGVKKTLKCKYNNSFSGL